MKRLIAVLALSATFMLAFQTTATAQSTGDTDQYFDESGDFTSRLWYGAGFVFPTFQGGANFSFFGLGLSPMVGYKVLPDFSVGARTALFYRYYNEAGLPAANVMDFGLAGFARYKLFNVFFLHAEYGFDNEVINFQYNFQADKLEPVRRLRNNGFVGAGYNTGNGLVGYEILLLYNLLHDETLYSTTPFDLRFGFTYKF